MNPTLARQLVIDAGFGVVEDLLQPAIALCPRILHASEPRHKRARWRDWLFSAASEGPAIETVPVLDELILPMGLSRFDSVPDVPFGFEWPCTASGQLMECIAQIDLAALPSRDTSPLPKTGWLIFFLCADPDKTDHRVVYVPSGESLTRWATHVPRRYTRLTCRLEFEAVFSLPDVSDWTVRQRIEFAGARADPYVTLQEALTDGARHYLLGYPRPIKSDVRAACVQSHSLSSQWEDCARTGSTEWSLLLQLDSDPSGPGWNWGDAGSVYYLINNKDLCAHRFDRTRVVLQWD